MKFLRQLFSFGSSSVSHASVLLAITALLSNLLGLGRNILFYRLIPPDQLDIYYASFRISDFIFNLLIFGAITSAFIPVITELITEHKEQEAHHVTNQLLSWATLFFLAITVILAIAMPTLTRWVVPGFEADRFNLTVQLSRLMLLQTIFFSWSFIIGGLLNGYQRFSSYALAPLIYNLSIILGGVLAARYGIITITYAVIAGSLLHFLIQFREAYLLGFRPRILLVFSQKIKEILSLMIPRSLSQGGSQIVLIVYTSLASTLQVGSIAVFTGINDLQTTPIVIIANSLAIASFPAITRFASKQQAEELNSLLLKLIRSALFLLIPIIILGYILRTQVIQLYFGAGGASWELTSLAVQTFAWFLIGIIPASLVAILARVFYAFKDTRTPMIINLSSAVLAILVGYLGIRYFLPNVSTLALAEALVAIFQASAYIIILYLRGILTMKPAQLLQHSLNYLTGALLAGLLSYASLSGITFLYRFFPFLDNNQIIALLLQSGVAALIGLGVYYGYSHLRSKEELQWVQKRSFIRET